MGRRSPLSLSNAPPGVMIRTAWIQPRRPLFMGNIIRIGVILLCVAALYYLVIQLGQGVAQG